jgi:hypothetical protein
VKRERREGNKGAKEIKGRKNESEGLNYDHFLLNLNWLFKLVIE